MSLWSRIKQWWTGLKRDKMSRLGTEDRSSEILKIIREVRRESHVRLEKAFDRFEQNVDIIAETRNKHILREHFQELIRECRTVVILPLRGTLEEVIIKRKAKRSYEI